MSECVIAGMGGGGLKIKSGIFDTSVDLGGIPQILFMSKFRNIGSGQYSNMEIIFSPKIGDIAGVLMGDPSSSQRQYVKIIANGFEYSHGVGGSFYYLAIM